MHIKLIRTTKASTAVVVMKKITKVKFRIGTSSALLGRSVWLAVRGEWILLIARQALNFAL
jgi:hypothetical protein